MKIHNHDRHRRLHGGIMIESMLALFLFSVCGVACLSLLMSSSVASRRAEENNQAYNAARQVLENVRLYKGNKIAAGAYNQSAVIAIGAVPQLDELNGASVAMNVADWTRSGVKYVRVTVQWRGRGGSREAKKRVLASLVGEKGVTE